MALEGPTPITYLAPIPTYYPAHTARFARSVRSPNQRYIAPVFLLAWLLVVVWFKKRTICSGVIFHFGEWGGKGVSESVVRVVRV